MLSHERWPLRTKKHGIIRLIELYFSLWSISVDSANGSKTSTSSRRTTFSYACHTSFSTNSSTARTSLPFYTPIIL